MKIDQCRLIHFPTLPDENGDLTFVEGKRHIPFTIERVFYSYNVPGLSQRGGHAHRKLEQLIICLGGSLEVILDDGFNKKTVSLSHPNTGLYVAPMTWVVLEKFSPGATCMVLASAYYDEQDYYRNYDAFLKAAKSAL